MGRTKDLFMESRYPENIPMIEEEQKPIVDLEVPSSEYILNRLIDAMVAKSEPSTNLGILKMIRGYQEEYLIEQKKEIEKLKTK